MKHSLVRTVGTLALVLSVAGVAQAQGKRCEMNGLQGSWAYTETGTVVLPTSPPTTAATMAVGRYTFDRDGTVTAIQWGSTAGAPGPKPTDPPDPPATKKGTYTIHGDCTITMVVDGYNAMGDLIRVSEWRIVLADNGKEMRGISRWLLFAPGNPPPKPPDVDLKPVMTMTATRITPSGGEPGEENEQGDQDKATSITVTDGSCKTPDPFVIIGGGVCANGGWRPRIR